MTNVESRSASPSEAARDRDHGSDDIISVRGLKKTFGSEPTTVAVDGVSFDISEGSVVGLLGPNGAGKTTTIKMLLGLIEPSGGTVTVDGIDVTKTPLAMYQSVSAMLEGARNIYWRLTVRENVRFFARLGDRPVDTGRIDQLIAQVGLDAKADEPVNNLSRGMKQKASLACTLVQETPIICLDEPTLGLDVESSVELRQELRRLGTRDGRTVLVSSHDMRVIEAICDRVIILNEGSVVADETVDDLLELFHRRTFRVTVDGELSSSVRESLESRFGAVRWERDGSRLRFEATDVQNDEFYEMTDLLRTTSATFVSIDTIEPDLEDVFLRVVDGTVEGSDD